MRDDAAESIVTLRAIERDGATFLATVAHVSRDGFARRVRVFAPLRDDVRGGWFVSDVSWYVAKATDRKLHKDGSIVVGVTGTSATHAALYALGLAMHGNGSSAALAWLTRQRY